MILPALARDAAGLFAGEGRFVLTLWIRYRALVMGSLGYRKCSKNGCMLPGGRRSGRVLRMDIHCLEGDRSRPMTWRGISNCLGRQRNDDAVGRSAWEDMSRALKRRLFLCLGRDVLFGLSLSLSHILSCCA